MWETSIVAVILISFVDTGTPIADRDSATPPRKTVVWPWARKTSEKSTAPEHPETDRREGWWQQMLMVWTDRPSDAVLKNRCQAKLFASRDLRHQTMEVDVEKSVATLSGLVESAAQAEIAERLAKKVAGIKRVENHLQVGRVENKTVRVEHPSLSAPKSLANKQVPAMEAVGKTQRPGLIRPSSELVNAAATLEPESGEPMPDRNRTTLVSRPSTIVIDPDLPTVTTYAIRRPTPASEIHRSLPTPKSNAHKNSTTNNRSANDGTSVKGKLIRPTETGDRTTDIKTAGPTKNSNQTPAITATEVLAGFVEPVAEPTEKAKVKVPAVSSAAPKAKNIRDSIPVEASVARLLKSDPRGKGIKFQMEGNSVVLFGSAKSLADIFELLADIGRLPGVERASIDRQRLELATSKPSSTIPAPAGE